MTKYLAACAFLLLVTHAIIYYLGYLNGHHDERQHPQDGIPRRTGADCMDSSWRARRDEDRASRRGGSSIGIGMLSSLIFLVLCFAGSSSAQIAPSYRRAYVALAAAGVASAALDVRETISFRREYGPAFRELDPLASRVVALPTPGYAIVSAMELAAMEFVGYRLSRSRRFRRVWWIPQAAQIAANSYGFAATRFGPRYTSR